MKHKQDRLFSKLRDIARAYRSSERGAAVVEFAMLAPVLFLLLIGTFQFGILINQYIQVAEATRVGGRTLAISRGATTPVTAAKNAFYASAPSLSQNNLTFTMTVNGTPCSVDFNCKSTMDGAQGTQASITVSYNACGAFVFGKEYMPNCNLSSTTSMRVE